MKVIFDIIADKKRTPQIQETIKGGKSSFRTKWGLYGTSDWLENIRKDNLTESIYGIISELLMTGHNDFSEFKATTESKVYQFECLGDLSKYVVGKKVNIEAIKNLHVNPISGLEHKLIPLFIEIED